MSKGKKMAGNVNFVEVLSLSEMAEYSNAFQNLLKMDIFHLLSFEAVVEKLRNHVTSHLRKLVVEDGNLLSHLQVYIFINI
jgi:hypothetical protein